MKIYKSLSDIPELKDMPILQVRWTFIKYLIKTFFHWSQWVGLVVLALPGCVLGYLLLWLLPDVLPLVSVPIQQGIAIVIALPMFIICAFTYNTIIYSAIGQMIREDSLKTGN